MEKEKQVIRLAEFRKLAEPFVAKLTPAQLRELTIDPKKKLADELKKTFTFVV